MCVFLNISTINNINQDYLVYMALIIYLLTFIFSIRMDPQMFDSFTIFTSYCKFKS